MRGRQSDQDLRFPLSEPFDTIECINGEQLPVSDFAHARDESESEHFAHARRHIFVSLRKHAYLNILKLLPPKKNEKFQIKKSDIFHISAQNIDCWYSLEPPRRGGSNECPKSLLFNKIRKIMYTPVNPSFTI